jgi:hypothetical protein
MHIHTIVNITPLLLLIHYNYYYSIILFFNPLLLHKVLEMLREGSSLYKWGVGEMANHMGYVKIAILVFSFGTLSLI